MFALRDALLNPSLEEWESRRPEDENYLRNRLAIEWVRDVWCCRATYHINKVEKIA